MMTILAGLNHLKKLILGNHSCKFHTIGDSNMVNPMVILDETSQEVEQHTIDSLYEEAPTPFQESHSKNQDAGLW